MRPAFDFTFVASLALLALLSGKMSAAGANSTPAAVVDVDLSAGSHAVVTIDTATLNAWEMLLAADSAVAMLLDQGQLQGIAEESEAIKAAAIALGENVHTNDKSLEKRLNSVIRQVVGFAERLRNAAGSGKRAKAETIYSNLHRYVEWAQVNVPALRSNEAINHRAGPQ